MSTGSFVFKDPYVSVNGTVLSDYVAECHIQGSVTLVEMPAGGDAAIARRIGLKDWKVDFVFRQKYGAGGVDATLWGCLGSEVALIIKPNGDTTSADNPKWTGNACLESYSPIDGVINQGLDAPVSFLGSDGSMILRSISDS